MGLAPLSHWKLTALVRPQSQAQLLFLSLVCVPDPYSRTEAKIWRSSQLVRLSIQDLAEQVKPQAERHRYG